MHTTNRAAVCSFWLGSLIGGPLRASAAGGISSLGGMLPIYLGLCFIGLGLIVWGPYSLYLLYRLRANAAPGRPKVSPILSVVLSGILLVLGSLGFVGPIVQLGAILLAIVVGATTALIVSRIRRGGNAA